MSRAGRGGLALISTQKNGESYLIIIGIICTLIMLKNAKKKNGMEVELVEMENEKYFCFVSTVQERK